MKIITDSSSDVLTLDDIDFANAPLKIISDDRQFVDDEQLDVAEMVEYLEHYKGKTKSSCPNTNDWLEAFDDAKEIFCVTITSGLSGSYNSAFSAKQIYEDEYPDRKVYIIDSLSAGPELRLIIEKLREYILSGFSFEEICDKIKDYQQNTGLIFMLKSLKNFANNGRVSPALAKIVGIVGICIVGKASDEGTLEPLEKCRGEARAIKKITDFLAESGIEKGKVSISHCQNETGAIALKKQIQDRFPSVQIDINECRGLCSFYAEKGGFLVGYEKF
ncbi:MAG: DegV family protein [Lachnospiraceae bacterium]|nr:DegV family protein [Lachnospiraceae bacterium]